jgi:hypothetical protein
MLLNQMEYRTVVTHSINHRTHVSNALSSALSAEIKDKIEIEYGLLERVYLL